MEKEMGYKIGYEIPLSKLEDLKSECRKMITMCNQVIPKRRELVEFGGNSDYEQQRINARINPEDYYKFRIWDKGCEIIYTSYYYDDKLEKFCRSRNYNYSIRYYGVMSRVFNDKRKFKDIKYNTDNTSYGCFEKLEEATKYFEIAVIDILQQLGIFENKLWDITEELKNGLQLSNKN